MSLSGRSGCVNILSESWFYHVIPKFGDKWPYVSEDKSACRQSRDGREVAAGQGMPAETRSGKKQGKLSSLDPGRNCGLATHLLQKWGSHFCCYPPNLWVICQDSHRKLTNPLWGWHYAECWGYGIERNRVLVSRHSIFVWKRSPKHNSML